MQRAESLRFTRVRQKTFRKGTIQFNSVQFSSRWYLSMHSEKPICAPPVSQKFPQRCLCNGSLEMSACPITTEVKPKGTTHKRPRLFGSISTSRCQLVINQGKRSERRHAGVGRNGYRVDSNHAARADRAMHVTSRGRLQLGF